MRLRAFALLALALSACGEYREKTATLAAADSVRKDSIARARQDSVNRTLPGYVVDSAFPVEEELRRFRKAVGRDSATTLTGGSPSREALVRRFVKALAENDTTAARGMALTVREFADLYYPASPLSRPPYHQSPALAWKLIQDRSMPDLVKAIVRSGGRAVTFVSEACEPKVLREGAFSRYTGCLVTLNENGKPVTRRYYGSILELRGQYKFLSYTNQN